MSTITRLRTTVAALVGLPVLEWRNGYGNSGSLHLGHRVVDRGRQANRARGSWVLNVWEAGVRLVLRESTDEVRRHPPVELRELGLQSLAGRVVERAVLTDDGTLSLYFVDSARVDISPTSTTLEDEEQWAIESETHGNFVVRTGPTVVEEANGTLSIPSDPA